MNDPARETDGVILALIMMVLILAIRLGVRGGGVRPPCSIDGWAILVVIMRVLNVDDQAP